MTRLTLLVLGLIALLFTPNAITATTWYVDDDHPTASECPCGTTNSACGTSVKPFTCIPDGIASTLPGDIVEVANGTYEKCFTIDHTNTTGIPIVIQSTNNNGAVLKMDANCAAPNENAVVLIKSSYIILKRFYVDGAGTAESGILIKGGAADEIQQGTVSGAVNGLSIAYTEISSPAPSVIITDLVAHHNTNHGMAVCRTDKPDCVDDSSVLIQRLTSYDNGHEGLLVGDTVGAISILDSTLTHNGWDAPAAYSGLRIYADDCIVSNLTAKQNGSYGIQLGGSHCVVTGSEIAENGDKTPGQGGNVLILDDINLGSPTGNTFNQVDIHHSKAGDGVKIGYAVLGFDNGARDTVFENCHIHHNMADGILETGYAQGTVIRSCEVDNNGGKPAFGHGFYMKGHEGLIQDNYVHHNAYYGIQLWAAPTGSASKHYIVERNEVFANGTVLPHHPYQGGGIVVGGHAKERACDPASPCSACPRSGLPSFVEVRYNVVHHNHYSGINYLVYPDTACGETGCQSKDHDNTIHHNTTYDNDVELAMKYANDDGGSPKLLVKNNIFVGGANQLKLIEAVNTRLPVTALDGNYYYRAGATSSTRMFYWNGWAPATVDGTPLYHFTDMRAPAGVRQSATCADATSGDPATKMELRGSFGNGVPFIDASTAAWGTSSVRPGNYRLKKFNGVGIGVCCSGMNGGLDIDFETVATCSPESCASPNGNGRGADYYFDTDADLVADLFDCNPFNSSVTTICDGSAYEGAGGCGSNYLTAPYDPSIHSTAAEVCDGKDNDCNGSMGSGETDADLDGVFPCNGDSVDDDVAVYPGHLEWCDGRDNDLNGEYLIGETTDQDQDDYPLCDDCNDNDSAVNPGHEEVCDSKDNDCDGVVDEGC